MLGVLDGKGRKLAAADTGMHDVVDVVATSANGRVMGHVGAVLGKHGITNGTTAAISTLRSGDTTTVGCALATLCGDLVSDATI